MFRKKTTHSRPERSYNPARRILAAAVALLGLCYGVMATTGSLDASTTVRVDNDISPTEPDFVTLQMRLQEVDLTHRLLQATVLPAPHGGLVGRKPGEINRGLRIEVVSGGGTTSVATFPGRSVNYPTPIELPIDRGDTAYPFDRPFGDFGLSVRDERTGAAVPFALQLENAARPWVVAAAVGEPARDGAAVVYPVQLNGHRGGLTMALVLFYVLVMLLITLIAVVTIGSALVRKDLEFSNVIWLSATVLVFPTLRSVMPNAPPLGTAVDYVIFFPCICAVVIMLLWTGAHQLRAEGAVLVGSRPRAGVSARDGEDTAGLPA